MSRNSTQHVCSGALAVATLLCVPAACAPAAEMQRVLVYNVARVPPAILNQAQREASRIFLEAGIKVRWLNCISGQEGNREASECNEYLRGEPVVLKLVSGSSGNPRSQALGYTIVTPEGGTYASVYWNRVADLADATEARCRGSREVLSRAGYHQILGHAIAHEIGHLLIPTGQHTPTGLMSAGWDDQALRQAARGKLLFNREQAGKMREQVKRRAAASTIALAQ